jgi:polysaccharide chain length determinant protein (PEP-CTERM system associated)
MHDIQRLVRTVLADMWRYRWQGLLVATLVALIGTSLVWRMRDRYEATARIYVDTQSVLKPLMSGLAVQPDVNQQLAMLGRTLISRPNVEKLVRMSDFDLATQSDSDRQATIERLLRDLKIGGTGRDNLYNLSFRDEEPERAKRAVQSLVTIFVESGMQASRKDANAAKVFINDQIKNYQGKLEEAEARLKDFRLRNLDVDISDGRDAASRLAVANAELQKAALELREAEKASEAARSALAAETGSATQSTQSILQESALSVSTPELDARIAAQKTNLDGLLQRFTDQHPDVLSTRRVIDDLEGERKRQVAELRRVALRAPVSSAPASESLAAQELRRMLATNEVQAAALRARVGEFSARVAQAKNALKTAPKLEAEASQLNRDYAIHKKNYEDLVSRRETAAISGELEEVSGVADFRLIDPPFVKPNPVWPNRTSFMLTTLGAALASGLAVAFLATRLRPVFHHAGELRAKFGVPVVGMVSPALALVDRSIRRGQAWRFSSAFVGLVLMCGAAMMAMRYLTRI